MKEAEAGTRLSPSPPAAGLAAAPATASADGVQFTPIRPPSGSGAVPGITMSLGSPAVATKRQLFPTLKVEGLPTFADAPATAEAAPAPESTQFAAASERFKAALREAIQSSTPAPTERMSPQSARATTPVSFVSMSSRKLRREDSLKSTRMQAAGADAMSTGTRSRAASVDSASQSWRRSSRSAIGPARNIVPSRAVRPSPRPLTADESVVAAAMAPAEQALADRMAARLARAKIEIKMQQVCVYVILVSVLLAYSCVCVCVCLCVLCVCICVQVESEFKGTLGAFNDWAKPTQ